LEGHQSPQDQFGSQGPHQYPRAPPAVPEEGLVDPSFTKTCWHQSYPVMSQMKKLRLSLNLREGFHWGPVGWTGLGWGH